MIAPTKNRVLLKKEPLIRDDQNKAGIILPDAVKFNKQGGLLSWATIEAMGEIDPDKENPAVKVGARVLFNDYDAYQVQGQEDVFLSPVEGVYAVDLK